MGVERVMDILWDRFCWPMMLRDVETHICHYGCCLCFKAKQNMDELHPLLATTPPELIHIDFLTIEKPKTDKDVNRLVTIDHFTHYAKAVVTPNQTSRTTVLAFWKHFIVDYGFPDHLLMDQGHNFESNLIKQLCNLAKVKKFKTTPYHLETNGQCERFNSSLINMIGTLEQRDKSHLKDFLPMPLNTYNCTKNKPTEFSPYYLMFVRKPQLPIDLCFGLTIETSIEHPHNKFIQKLSERLC